MLPVAILAGGLATRLRPITETIPKSLVQVAGQPFIARQLKYLQGQAVSRVVLCVGYLGEMVEAVVKNGSEFGLRVDYSFDGKTLLGTAGALKRALPLLGNEFFVLYGDSYLPVDFMAVEQTYRVNGKSALMTVMKNGNRWDKSNVLFKSGSLLDYDKRTPSPDMNHIDYGLSVMSASVIKDIPGDVAVDLADVFHALAERGDLAGFEVNERFYEVGSHTGLREAEAYFVSKGL